MTAHHQNLYSTQTEFYVPPPLSSDDRKDGRLPHNGTREAHSQGFSEATQQAQSIQIPVGENLSAFTRNEADHSDEAGMEGNGVPTPIRILIAGLQTYLTISLV